MSKTQYRNGRKPVFDLIEKKPALAIIAWSLACAGAMIGIGLAIGASEFPGPELFVLPVWFTGFAWLAGKGA